MKNYLLILISLLILNGAKAESPSFDQRVQITDPGELYSTFDLNASAGKVSLKRIFGTSYNDMIEHSTEAGWPTGLSTLDNRTDHKDDYNDFVMYKVLEFGDYCMIQIPSAENKNLPYDLKAAYDFYMVFNKKAVEEYSASVISSQTGVPAKLLATGDLRSTFNLATTDFNRDIRRQVGNEYEKIIANSKEDAWPSGIATMSARDLVRDEMLKYKVWMIAEFDGKYIIRIPAEENTFMPYNMRPSKDIYFTIDTKDVQLLK